MFVPYTSNVLSSSDESCEEDFEYDSALDDSGDSSDSDSEEEEAVNLTLDDVFNGRFVLYRWSVKEYYIGTVTDITINDVKYEITVSLMKKYSVRGNRVTFNWPTVPHIVVIDDFTLRSIPVPIIDRRGTSAIYDIKNFNKIPINNIC